jgi:ketosteroid isomerase-like protein
VTRDDEIVAAELALYRAMIAQDFDALRAMLAEDLVYIHSTAVAETKEAYLAGVAAGLYDYGEIETRQATTWCDGDLAIRTGLMDMLVGERGKPKELTRLLFTTCWRREKAGWRLLLRQATRVRSP